MLRLRCRKLRSSYMKIAGTLRPSLFFNKLIEIQREMPPEICKKHNIFTCKNKTKQKKYPTAVHASLTGLLSRAQKPPCPWQPGQKHPLYSPSGLFVCKAQACYPGLPATLTTELRRRRWLQAAPPCCGPRYANAHTGAHTHVHTDRTKLRASPTPWPCQSG